MKYFIFTILLLTTIHCSCQNNFKKIGINKFLKVNTKKNVFYNFEDYDGITLNNGGEMNIGEFIITKKTDNTIINFTMGNGYVYKHLEVIINQKLKIISYQYNEDYDAIDDDKITKYKVQNIKLVLNQSPFEPELNKLIGYFKLKVDIETTSVSNKKIKIKEKTDFSGQFINKKYE